MGNPHDAADGLQDGLVAAYRRADTFRGDAAVTTWLHRVVVNACLDRLRAAKVRRADAAARRPRRARATAGRRTTATSAADDPEQAAIADDRRRAVLAALATLPAEQRAALVLVDMEGYPVAEVAADARLRRGHGEVAVLPRPRPARRAAPRPAGRLGRAADRDATSPGTGARGRPSDRSPAEPHPDTEPAGEGGAP